VTFLEETFDEAHEETPRLRRSIHEPVYYEPLPLPRDIEAALPLHLGATLVVHTLGNVVWDREGFHTDRYLYAPGYMSERLYFLMSNPTTKGWWRSTIVDMGDDNPLFRVIEVQHPEICFEGSTPSRPWALVMRAMNDLRPEVRKLAVSGPDFFGLSNPIVLRYMARLPYADRCSRFIPITPAVADVSESSDSETPSRPVKEVRPTQIPNGRSFKVNFKALIAKARNLKLSEDAILHQFGEVL
jgi:chromodomain-helicase-DNA-binding protein 7